MEKTALLIGFGHSACEIEWVCEIPSKIIMIIAVQINNFTFEILDQDSWSFKLVETVKQLKHNEKKTRSKAAENLIKSDILVK